MYTQTYLPSCPSHPGSGKFLIVSSLASATLLKCSIHHSLPSAVLPFRPVKFVSILVNVIYRSSDVVWKKTNDGRFFFPFHGKLIFLFCKIKGTLDCPFIYFLSLIIVCGRCSLYFICFVGLWISPRLQLVHLGFGNS